MQIGNFNTPPDAVPQEMQHIVARINQWLEKTTLRLERSRTGLANLAHAMKGPLSTLSQVMHHPGVMADETLRGEVEERLTSLTNLVERELRRARLSDHSLPTRFFNPEKEVNALVRTLKSLNFQKNVQVELTVPPNLLMPFDQEDMMELLGNLLDNAFKWCDGRIRVEIGERGKECFFVVEDNGPGVSEEQMEHITRRGVRLDESRSGHGMGLAIVSQIVEHYHGRIHFHRAPSLGGFGVEVALPASS
ncbi:MAG: GHKL domain-containing protein [Magnetococcales bacterium]|nr:GHKL domain-containing protein [Magnetococcales bacterium]